MNRFGSVAFAVLCLLSAGCSSSKQIKGSGNVTNQTRTVADFDTVSLAGSGQRSRTPVSRNRATAGGTNGETSPPRAAT